MPSASSVSVVIATYNGARYIRDAIASVQAQTLSPLEIIVVDDGSQDDTPTILESYGSALVVVSQRNKGHGAARNAGLSVARGRYVALMDHDDTCKPERFERQWTALQENPDAVACFTGYWVFNEAGWERDCPADVNANRRAATEYLSNVLFHYPTAFYDRERASDVRYPEGIPIGEDLIFSAKLSTRGALIAISDVLYGYRMHPAQLSRRSWVDSSSNPYFEVRYNWVKEHWQQFWPTHTWSEIEAALWDGLVRQTEAAYWARNRHFFLHDRNYMRTAWPAHLPSPSVRDWRWYPDWLWTVKGWIDRVLRRTKTGSVTVPSLPGGS